MKVHVIYLCPTSVTSSLQSPNFPLSTLFSNALSPCFSLNVTGQFAQRISSVRSEVHAAVFMKSSIFRNITQCSSLKMNRRFGGTSSLQLQGIRKSETKPAWKRVPSSTVNAGFLLNRFYDQSIYFFTRSLPWPLPEFFLPKRGQRLLQRGNRNICLQTDSLSRLRPFLLSH
jgi:hypothetical protein